MGFIDELKRLARPYEDEDEDDFEDDFEPVTRSDRGERKDKSAKMDSSASLFQPEEPRRSNKVVNITPPPSSRWCW